MLRFETKLQKCIRMRITSPNEKFEYCYPLIILSDITIINSIGDEKKDEEHTPPKPEVNDTTFGIQESGSDSDITKSKTLEPEDPREEERLQPEDDGKGEKGLSSDLPFFAQALERQHQKESEDGAKKKIALGNNTVDQQDL